RPRGRRRHRVSERAEPVAEALRDHGEDRQSHEQTEVDDGSAAQGKVAQHGCGPLRGPQPAAATERLRAAAHRRDRPWARAWVAIPVSLDRLWSHASHPPRLAALNRAWNTGNPG